MKTLEDVQKKYPHKVIVREHDSMADFHDWVINSQRKYGSVYSFGSQRRIENTLPKLLKSCSDYDKPIGDLIDKMQQDDLFASGLPLPEAHYTGSRVSVSRYLNGLPKNMIRRVHGENSGLNTPINIFVNINLSGNLDEHTQAIKGAAISALAVALNSSRPVSIWLVKPLSIFGSQLPWTITKIKLNEQVIDLSKTSFAICSEECHREVMWEGGRWIACEAANERISCGTYGHWPFDGNVDSANYNDAVKAYVGCTANDIWIPGSASYNLKLIADPIAWVKEQIEAHKQRHFEGEDE